MLTLKRDHSGASNDSETDYNNNPPKYILLNDTSTVGRGLKSDVRLLFPWLSRRHFTVLRQGSFSYVQAHAQTAVFVNGASTCWCLLHDKDCITIGGAKKGLREGSPFPAIPSHFIEYVYHKSTHPITDKENIYKYEGVSDSFTLKEEVNGRLVEEVYCSEDFNETQECIELPELWNDAKEEPPDEPSNSQLYRLYHNGGSRRSSIRSRSRESCKKIEGELSCDDISESQASGRQCQSRAGDLPNSQTTDKNSQSTSSALDTLADAKEPSDEPSNSQLYRLYHNGRSRRSSSRSRSRDSSSPLDTFVAREEIVETEIESKSPAKNMPAKKGRRKGARGRGKRDSATVAKIAVPDAESSRSSSVISLPSTSSLSTSSSVLSSDVMETSSSVANAASCDDPWSRFDQVAKRAENIISKLDEKEANNASIDNEEDPKSSSKVSTGPNHADGEPVDSDTCRFLSSMAEDEKRNKERMITGLTTGLGTGISTGLSFGLSSGSAAKKLRIRSPKKEIRRSKRESKVLKYIESDESGSDDDGLVNKKVSNPETKNKSKPEHGEKLDGADGCLPDLDDVSHTEVVGSEDELPDILPTQTPEKTNTWSLPKKRKADNVGDFGPPTKKLAKGKGKSKSKCNQSGKEIDAVTQALIDKWQRAPAKSVKPKYRKVLDDCFFYGDVNFSDPVFELMMNEGPGDANFGYCAGTRYKITLTVDVANLKEKLISGDLGADDLDRVFKLIARTRQPFSMKDFDKPRLLPNDYTVVQPACVRLELKQYQLNTLSWMMTVEGKTERGWHTPKLTHWENSGLDLMFDVNRKRVFMPPFPKNSETMLTIKSKGGILADQMGLGKTITLLALFAMNQAPAQRVPDPDMFRYQDSYRLPSGATLVVAPSHLVGQWKEEVEKHMDGLTAYIITTKLHFEKLSYLDLMLADVVIISVQFLLSNKAFTGMPSGEGANTSFMKLLRKSGINPLLTKPPNLCHLHWWRVVADEAHELLKYEDKYVRRLGQRCQPSEGLECLSKFKSKYRWYVSGTPFPHGGLSLRAALKFLEVDVDDSSLVHDDNSLKVDKLDSDLAHLETLYDVDLSCVNTYPLHHMVLNHLYVRNTKTSIGGEYTVPEFIEELILLTMSDVERGVYDRSVSQLERRKLCCHLQIVERIQQVAGVQQKSLEEVRLSLVEQAHKDIAYSEKMIASVKEDIKRNKSDLAKEDKDSIRKALQARGTRLRESMKGHEDDLIKHRSAISYFDNIMPRIDHSADEPCVICLENIENLAVTPCGHLFCRNCILPCVHAQHMCPTCRKPIHSDDQIIEVKDAKGRQELHKSTELRQLTEKYGTKMAFLIFYLRNLFSDERDSRVIIFSQWDSLLKNIGETLHENSINNVFVKGNVHMRNKAINSFRKQHKTRVIMLSLQNAASGTNLVEATHVVLIDPVAGSKEEAIAVESQAIGRAHRMGQDKQISVVRMVMRDTIEHELYLRNNSEDIAQVEFDFNKNGALGGPQVVRTTRKVPDPDPAVLRSAIQNLQPDPPADSRRGRGRGSWGWRRRGTGTQYPFLQLPAADDIIDVDYLNDYSDDDDDHIGEPSGCLQS